MHVFRHPKYYQELREARRKEEASSDKLQAEEATSSKSHKPQASSIKPQATSIKKNKK